MKRSVDTARAEFPILDREFHGHRLVYLDSGATTLKPKAVVQRISDYYLYESANVHRGAYALSDQATKNFEDARATAAAFIGALPEEIVFVRNTTEGVNLVANTWGVTKLKAGDRILLTEMEHHGNLVPWQLLADRQQLGIDVVGITDDGLLNEKDLSSKWTDRTRLFAFTGCSNTLGTINDVSRLIKMAHDHQALALVDAAQLISQRPIDVKALDVDFLVFSGHKLFGPTGIGVLYARKELLRDMPPWQGGGSMISAVSFQGTTYNDGPFRFEAGTPHIEGTVGLAAAIDWFRGFDFDEIRKHEMHLLKVATDGLKAIPGIKVYADVPDKGAILSFNLEGTHPSDVSQILDQQGVAVRSGHHCTQPLMKRLGVPGTVRASFSIYNNEDDVQRLLSAVRKAKEILT